jgi:carbamoyl-phosphate synthase large subunit
MVVNTGSGDETKRDGYEIRRAALKFNLPYATTVAGAKAMCEGVAALKGRRLEVMSLQEYHQQLKMLADQRRAG